MRRLRVNIVIAVVCSLAACTGPSLQTPTLTTTIASSPIQTPSKTAMPTDTPVPSELIDNIPTVCPSQLLAYSIRTGIAFTCADNPSTMSTIDLSAWLSDSTFQDFSISPNREYLAFATATRGPVSTTMWRLYIVNFETRKVTSILDGTDAFLQLSWTNDGRYLVYSREFSAIVILDVQTGTTSEIPVESEIMHLNAASGSFGRVDGQLHPEIVLSYGKLEGPGQNPQIVSYLAFIDCSHTPFECSETKTTHLEWATNWWSLAWSPDGSLVGQTTLGPPSPDQTYALDIIRLDGTSLRHIDLSAILHGIGPDYRKNVAFSSDNTKIAFVGVIFDVGPALFVFDIETEQVTVLVQSNDVNLVGVQWLWSP